LWSQTHVVTVARVRPDNFAAADRVSNLADQASVGLFWSEEGSAPREAP
jgi:hypothetical protein